MATKAARILADLQQLVDELESSYHLTTGDVIREIQQIIGKHATEVK
jgi:hypothetical protein